MDTLTAPAPSTLHMKNRLEKYFDEQENDKDVHDNLTQLEDAVAAQEVLLSKLQSLINNLTGTKK